MSTHDSANNRLNWIWHRAPCGAIRGKNGRKRLVTPEERETYLKQRALKTRKPKPPAIQNLLRRAYELKDRLGENPGLAHPEHDNEGVRRQSGKRLALAHELKMDPSQLTRFLNLVNLAPKIQTYIWGLPATVHRPVINDRDWHRLARIHDRESQLREFATMVAASKRHFTSSADIGLLKEAAPTFA